MERIPPVKVVMTTFPYSVERTEPLEDARDMMREHGLRHLPVTERHALVGVISDRDIRRVLASRLGLADVEALEVGDAMSDDLYAVALDTPLDEVLAGMAERHVGCAVVTRQGRLAGILTTTDVCRLFADHLAGHRPGGNDAA